MVWGRFRVWIGVVAFALTGCGVSSEEAHREASAAQEAAYAADRRAREALAKIDELERQVADLENTIGDLEIELMRVAHQASNAEGVALSRR